MPGCGALAKVPLFDGSLTIACRWRLSPTRSCQTPISYARGGRYLNGPRAFTSSHGAGPSRARPPRRRRAGRCAKTAPAQAPTPPPATERPLLGAPDPAGATQRGVFLKDPKGQIERIAAGGHLVAWSVRTPADTHRNRGGEWFTPPKAMPDASKVVIVDERGGAALSVELGRRWVAQLRLVRGPGGPTEPQLAVRSCASRTEKRCTDELIALTADMPPLVAGRTTGVDATAALEGRLDSGRLLGADGKSCAARLSVREPNGTRRTLRRLPGRHREYTRCRGIGTLLIYGRYAFASVMREWPRYSFDAEFFYGIDLAAGPSARWTEVARPYRGTEGGAAIGIGPAVTDQALYWEEYDSLNERIDALTQVALPRDIESEPTIHTPSRSRANRIRRRRGLRHRRY